MRNAAIHVEAAGSAPREQTTMRGQADEALQLDPSEQLTLEIAHAPDARAQGRRASLDPAAVLTVGRDVESRHGLRVEDPRLSRLHVRIVWDTLAARFRCTDSGSANGSFLNGARFTSALLSAGDVVRLGDTLLVCRPAPDELADAARLHRIASSHLAVLVLGETGTGKERMCRRLHDISGRSGAFVAVNCGGLSREFASAELFGHTRHAFSGANAAREGLFRAAAEGTLLLDEIGDLPLELQPVLLRVLQEGTIRPLGSDRELGVNARIIAATHRDLSEAVRAGAFREDLYARLSQITLTLPPLRARRWEILPLARSFAPALSFTPAAAEALLIGSWPRNIRELKAVLESAAVVASPDGLLKLTDLHQIADTVILARKQSAELSVAPEHAGEASKRNELVLLMHKHQGSVAGVARALNKPRSQIYRWLKNFGLEQAKFRENEESRP